MKRTKYFLTHDGFIYRKTATTTEYWYKGSAMTHNQWMASMCFKHSDIELYTQNEMVRITRDEARKKFPKAFKA